jgi:hypothetical protein
MILGIFLGFDQLNDKLVYGPRLHVYQTQGSIFSHRGLRIETMVHLHSQAHTFTPLMMPLDGFKRGIVGK